MKKSRRAGVAVTDRDERLFRYLFVNKAATVGDIRADIFGGIDTKAVHNRLNKLSLAGLVEASAQRERRNRLVYSLTKKGFKKYIADEGTVRRIQLKSDCPDHDLTLLAIKRKFRTFKNVLGFYSENLVGSGLMDEKEKALKRLGELRADAVVKLKVGENIYFLPLEYEASSKYSKRNAKLLAKYYTNPHVAGVVFISRTAAIEKRIRLKEAAGRKDGRGMFYYCLLEEVLEAKDALAFANAENDILAIR